MRVNSQDVCCDGLFVPSRDVLARLSKERLKHRFVLQKLMWGFGAFVPQLTFMFGPDGNLSPPRKTYRNEDGFCVPEMEADLPKNAHIGKILFGLAGGGLIEQNQKRSRVIETKTTIYVLSSMKVSDDSGTVLADVHGAAISTKYLNVSFSSTERIVAVRVDTDGFDAVLEVHFLIWDSKN